MSQNTTASATIDGSTFKAPSPFALRATVAIICVYAALALALVPIASQPGPQLGGFVTVFITGVLITELATSFLLFIRFDENHSWSLLLLACAYLFSGLMAGLQLLLFPGAVVAGQPLLAISESSSAWIFSIWINGFALLTFIAVVLEAWFSGYTISAQNVRRAAIVGSLVVLVTVVATACALMVAGDRMPLLVAGQTFTPITWAVRGFAIALSCLGIAIILFVIRERSHLHLWLSLALTALVFHNILAAAGGGRFTVGWSLGRLSWLVSACALFVYFLGQFARQQRLLARTSDILEHHVETRGVDLNKPIDVRPRNPDASIERFLAKENIERYKQMLQSPRDDSHRQVLSRLLAEEETRLRSLPASQRPGQH
jgi:hypothetical protein